MKLLDRFRKKPEPKRKHKRLPVYLTRSEAQALLGVARANSPKGVNPNRNVALVALMLYSGLRVAEVVGLDRSDIDFEDETIHVRHGKGDKERFAPLHPDAARPLRAYWNSRTDTDVAAFLSRRHTRLSTRMVRYIVTDLAKDAGIMKVVSPHKLRHTFATMLTDSGVDLQTVQQLLGHASIQTTTIYSHVSQARKRDAVSRLSLESDKSDIPPP